MTIREPLNHMRNLLRNQLQSGRWNGDEALAVEIICATGLFTAAEVIEYAIDAAKAEAPQREPAPCF